MGTICTLEFQKENTQAASEDCFKCHSDKFQWGKIEFLKLNYAMFIEDSSSGHGWRKRMSPRTFAHALITFVPQNSNKAKNFLYFGISFIRIAADFDGANGRPGYRYYTVFVTRI